MPLISFAVITGNCAEYMVRFLDSFGPAFDELCLVRAIGAQDPDESLQLAQTWCQANGKSFRFDEYHNAPGNNLWPHIDNFAAARQMSFDLATCPMILWADLDDVLESGAEILRELAARANYPAVVCPYKIFARGVTVNRVRMMSRGSGRWHYPVHEDYLFHIAPPLGVDDQRIVITHLPDFQTKKGSNERNLKILQSIPGKEMTCGLWFHLHGELAATGDTEGSIAAAKQALGSPEIGKAEKYEIMLNFAQLAKDPSQKEAFLHEAYKADPARREALGLLANNALNFNRVEAAVAYASQMMATPRPAMLEWNSRQAVYGWVGDDLYAQALRAAGRHKEAENVRLNSLARAGGPRIALVHATRGRPEQAALARKLALDLAERPDQIEYLFVFDPADRESEMLGRFHHLKVPGPCVAAWNAGALASMSPIIVQMSDDFVFPARWDQMILERLGDISKPKVLAVSDGLRADDLITMAIVTSAYLAVDGFLFHPWFESVYSDNAFTELAYKRGLVIEARDLVFSHEHPIKTGKPLDATYEAQNSPQRYHEGKKVLEHIRTGNDWSTVPGFFDYWDFYELIARRLKDGDVVAEIGVWFGRSLIYLAQTCRRLGKSVSFVAVDTFKGEANQPAHEKIVAAAGGSIRAAFESNIRRCGVADMIQIIDGDSAASAAAVPDQSLACVFIDAAHDYDSARADILAWKPKLKPGGMLAGHDYPHPPVAAAVKDTLGTVNVMRRVWFL